MEQDSIFINRELSWLDFDSRVLALAKEKSVPLGERLKFGSISEKLRLIRLYGLHGAGYWNLDRPFPQGWTVLNALWDVANFPPAG